MKKIALFLLLFFVNTFTGFSTHIRAGEITATVIDCQSFKYRFTILGYTDTGSDVRFGGGEVDFGDGSPLRSFKASDFKFQRRLGDDVAVTAYTVDHSFPGAGTYVISFREFNRNEGVVNIENSVQTPFYIETSIQIDPFLGCNETVQLSIPPIDKAGVGIKFIHNPGAYDPDGDSLSYELVINRMQRDLYGTNGQVNHGYVNGYKFPNDSFFGGKVEGTETPATYRMDSITGDLVWDSPGIKGEYNVAFRVHEWRYSQANKEWIHQGYVTRDMQIIVEDTENKPPELEIPADTCVQSNTPLSAIASASDPDGDPVQLEAFGEVFNTSIGNKASITSVGNSLMPKLLFQWRPTCEQVREKPYEVRFKASDKPIRSNGLKPISLASFKTWNVKVVAPAPNLLSVENTGKDSIKLKWQKYASSFNCGTRTNDVMIQIYRKIGTYDFNPSNCEVGIPEDGDYELLSEVSDSGEFMDTTKSLNNGTNYCYRIVAVLKDQKGGTSYASQEQCFVLEPKDGKAPAIITNVDIETTDEKKGAILIKWLKPYNFDALVYSEPFTYELYRREVGVVDFTKIVSTDKLNFLDTALNTENRQYEYYILALDSDETRLEKSGIAQSLRLDINLSKTNFDLKWNALTPWSNKTSEHRYHYIYRDNVKSSDASAYVLLDSVDVIKNGFNYYDNSETFSLDKKYCYYITSQGSYGNPSAIPEPLLNKSQRVCAQPDDGKAPCTPKSFRIDLGNEFEDCKAFVQSLSCASGVYYKNLNWESSSEGDCDNGISAYEIYFSKFENSEFELLATVKESNYLHDGLNSLAGCYYIIAIDRSGNRSEPSETVCVDNCPYFKLPNVFTPNGDGVNETFRPFGVTENNLNNDPSRCPRFVKTMTFTVYDHHGTEVYSLHSTEKDFLDQSKELKDIYINWNGQDAKGQEMLNGVYYYYVEVSYFGLNPEGGQEKYKGWVQLLK